MHQGGERRPQPPGVHGEPGHAAAHHGKLRPPVPPSPPPRAPAGRRSPGTPCPRPGPPAPRRSRRFHPAAGTAPAAAPAHASPRTPAPCTSRGEARRRPPRTSSPARSHAPSAAPPARPRGAATGTAPSHARPAPPSRTPGTPAARPPAAARPDPDPRLPSTSASPSVRYTTALPDAAKRSGRAVFACKTSPPNRRDIRPGKPGQQHQDRDHRQWPGHPISYPSRASPDNTRSYRTVYDYDSFNRLGRASQPKSTTMERGTLIWAGTSYDANNNVVAAQDAHYGQQDAGDGAVTTYGYDKMDRKTLTTSPDTQADPAGQRTRMDYDAAGRLITLILPKGVQSGIAKDHTTSYSYDAADQLTAQTQYQVNSSGTVTDTRTTYFCYSNVGNKISVTAPNAQLPGPPNCASTTTPSTTRYGYDDAHQRTSVTDPQGHQQSVAYDADDNVETSTDANGKVTVNTYDQKDQLVKVVAPFVPGGRTTTTEYQYDANGNKITDIPPRAYDASADTTTFTTYVTRYSHDADNEMVRQATPTDANTPPAYIHYSYDAGGRQIAVSLPVSQSDPAKVQAAAKTTTTYFDPGWVASSTDPAVPAVHFGYTAQGWQATRRTDSPNGAPGGSLLETWQYYPGGKARSYTDKGGQSSTYHYDADNNLTYASVLNAAPVPIQIYADYTPFDQLAATHEAAAGTATFTGTAYTYDHDGNVAERDDNGGETLASQTTNSQGVPISWTFTPVTGSPPDITQFTYDTADWLKVQDDLNTTPTSCNADRRITTSWTPAGQEDTQQISVADSSCTYNPKQSP